MSGTGGGRRSRLWNLEFCDECKCISKRILLTASLFLILFSFVLRIFSFVYNIYTTLRVFLVTSYIKNITFFKLPSSLFTIYWTKMAEKCRLNWHTFLHRKWELWIINIFSELPKIWKWKRTLSRWTKPWDYNTALTALHCTVGNFQLVMRKKRMTLSKYLNWTH